MRFPLFKRDDSYEFKPLLAEIESEPTSPLAHTILWLVVATLVFFLTWSVLGKVDIVVTAPGKVIPTGHVKVIQPLEGGMVSSLYVKEGDFVHKGQTLVCIDPTVNTGELESASKNLGLTDLEIERLQSTVSGHPFVAYNAADPQVARSQQELYRSEINALAKELSSKQAELKKVQEEEKETQAQRDASCNLLQIALAKQERLKPVMALIAVDELDKNQKDIATYQGETQASEHKLSGLYHQQEQLQEELAGIQYEFNSKHLKDLSDRQKNAAELNAKVQELSFKQRKQVLASPIDGYIDALSIHNTGCVVTPAQKLMEIIPANAPLLVDVSVSNNDIGFVSTGMKAQIKVDTYEFQKYGMYEGEVVSIEKNSHEEESKKQQEQQQQQANQSEPAEKKLNQVYEVFIRPTKKYLMVEGTDRPLQPGMTLVAEMKTNKRRIIEFLIYPLIKYWHNGITVR